MFLLMKKTRAKKFKVRMFYHLQNLFWGVFVRGVLALGISVQGFVGGFMSGGRIPVEEYPSLSSPFTHALLLLYLTCKEHLFATLYVCFVHFFIFFFFHLFVLCPFLYIFLIAPLLFAF